MRIRFNQSFKIQAVEKALGRSDVTTLKEVADSLGVGGINARANANAPSEAKNLKHENKVLKKELNRKDKALAETAALLVIHGSKDSMIPAAEAHPRSSSKPK